MIRESRTKDRFKRRNTMSEETKKVEKIEQGKPETQDVKPAELVDKDLDNVAGGSKFTLGNKTGGTNPL
jgi:hypothetical protein